jgi:hypothetical protein
LLLEYVISHPKEIETENWNKWLNAEMDDYSMAALLEGYVAKLEGWAKWIKDGWPLAGLLAHLCTCKDCTKGSNPDISH